MVIIDIMTGYPCRLAILMLVSLAVNAVFLCEQPVGSSDVFPYHPRLAWIFNRVALAPHQKLWACNW